MIKEIFKENMKQARYHLLWEKLADEYPFGVLDKVDWAWSDQHFGHKNIIKFSDRPFKDLDEMREIMIHNYNSVVKPNDVCVWGGDVAFLPDDEANEILHRCGGTKILIIGNHDLHKKKGLKKLHFDKIYTIAQYKDMFFTHYPLQGLPGFNIHGHEHVNGNETLVSHFHTNINVEFHNYTPVRVDKLLA